VGEPVGDALDFWSEGGNIILPNSRLCLHFANGFHSYSPREYPERKPYVEDLSVETVEPDIRVEATFADYRAGRDPALAAIIADQRRQTAHR
jgi:hypothetical protein